MGQNYQKNKSIVKIYILAAGFNQHLDKPCSLLSFPNGKNILDWQIGIFNKIFRNNDINLIVGYEYKKIIKQFGHLKHKYINDWNNKNSLQSFLEALDKWENQILVTYGDTVFHHSIIYEFSKINSDVVIGVDSKWKSRFFSRSENDLKIAEKIKDINGLTFEYTGLIKFSPTVNKWLIKNKEKYLNSKIKFTDLIFALKKNNFEIRYFDVFGGWAEMNEPNDLAHFILGNKAQTLARIKPLLKKSIICDQLTFSFKDWNKNNSNILNSIERKFHKTELIIRSCSPSEDGWDSSQAGVYDTVLDVKSNDQNEITKAIIQVFKSYKKISNNNQLLVQPLVKKVIISGVVFTCDLMTGAPYYVINYDDITGFTDSIPSGKQNIGKTIVIFKKNIINFPNLDSKILKIINGINEIENLLGYDKLDIEFAVDKNNHQYTFQIRPITVNHSYNPDYSLLKSALSNSQKVFNIKNRVSSSIFGNNVIYSKMMDWNPAEIIGERPNTLAISLYKFLITDDVWAKQRFEYGYRLLKSSQLMVEFCSQPYIDCRLSINSFIPLNLPEKLSKKLVNYYLDILKINPHLHDKMELDVIFTIWTPSFKDEIRERFKNRRITEGEINIYEKELKKITINAITRLKNDVSGIKTLKEKFIKIKNSNHTKIDKVYHLINDCKNYGTPAFAHAARAGFVSIAILKSLVKTGYLSDERMLEFQKSIKTVTGEFQDDLRSSEYNKTKILNKYGHLRPGTYDINKMAYWEDPDFFLSPKKNKNPLRKVRKFKFTKSEVFGFRFFIQSLGIKISSNQLISFIKNAIMLREKIKFEFTKNLSNALDNIISLSNESLGINRYDSGFISIDNLFNYREGKIDLDDLKKIIELNKFEFKKNQFIRLPSLIKNKEDFFCFEQDVTKANFITRSNVIGNISIMKDNNKKNIRMKIVATDSADPGFDWIFSHEIKGLITKYGGSNSHMAIRCAELGIPAAIGVGANFYNNLTEDKILLDCLNEKIVYI